MRSFEIEVIFAKHLFKSDFYFIPTNSLKQRTKLTGNKVNRGQGRQRTRSTKDKVRRGQG